MNNLNKITWLSEEDYLAGETLATIRHEYIDGRIYAMAGANARHNLISGNLFYHLRRVTGKGGSCQVFMNDMKLRIFEKNTFYYPDVMLCCDPEDNHDLYRESPCLIAEVLSPSTETIDRREKLLIYQKIPSLKYYLLIATHQMKVDYYQRAEDNNWYCGTLESEAILEIQCAQRNVAFCLEDFYQDVPMP